MEVTQEDKELPLYPMQPFDAIINGKYQSPIIQAIADLNLSQPSKIQSQVIPILNDETNKHDLLAQSQIGTGNTISILVSMLLHVDGDKHNLQTIYLCHTRELTLQIFSDFTQMNKYTKFEGDICIKNSEEKSPSKTAQLIFGTPTSIIHWIMKKELDVNDVNFVVIDEADCILNKYSALFPSTQMLMCDFFPKNVQYGFFSSTFRSSVIEYIKKMRPKIIIIRALRIIHKNRPIDHWYTKVEDINQAKEVIYELVNKFSKVQTFVFTRSKDKAIEICDYLISKEVQCKSFTSDTNSQERDKMLFQFRNDEFKVLVTTDVLSRGIDIPHASLVINLQTPIQVYVKSVHNNNGNHQSNTNKSKIDFDNVKVCIPDCNTYFHRAGRACRFNRHGICFTIVFDEKDENDLKLFCSERELNIPLNFISKSQIDNLPEEDSIQQKTQQIDALLSINQDKTNSTEKQQENEIEKLNSLLMKQKREFEIEMNKKEVELQSAQQKLHDLSLENQKLKQFELNQQIKNKKIDQIEQLGEIEYGNFGNVMKISMNGIYALKVLNENNQKQFQQLFNEFKIKNLLNHPNLLKIFGIFFGNEKNSPSILLEYCPFNLDKVIKEKIFSNSQIAISIYQIAEGMKYLHHNKIIHKNLNPSNIFITDNQMIKIADFGIIKMIETEEQEIDGIFGVQKFMAPEIINEEDNYDEKVDVYSFGVLVFFILNEGKLPKITLPQIAAGKKAEIPTTFTKFAKELIEKCWRFDPKDRPDFNTICEEIINNEFKLIELSRKDDSDIQEFFNQYKQTIPLYIE